MVTQKEISGRLLQLADEEYRVFTQRLIFTSKNKVLGVRIPLLKRLAQEYAAYYGEILRLPFESFEEVLLKGLCIAFADIPFIEKLPLIRKYAELVDNWSACDSFCTALKVKKGEMEQLRCAAEEMALSDSEFVSRVGIVLYFSKLKGEQDAVRAFEIYDKLRCGEYYRDMAMAWGVSVYCVYYPEITAQWLENAAVSDEVKRMAAQKIRDSRRISQSVKERISKAIARKHI